MMGTGVKQLIVPDGVYDEMKRLVDQASLKQDICQLLEHHGLSRAEQRTLLKSILTDISNYRGTPLLPLKGVILTLLTTTYALAPGDAFTVVDALLP
jgi:hypothetical protein